MKNSDTYDVSKGFVRLTKVREIFAAPCDERGQAVEPSVCEGSLGYHISPGYSLDGWFLDGPALGRGMVMLRFRRNETHRLGVFTSSPVTFVAENEVRTVNSVYRLEQFSFEMPEIQQGAGK